MGQSVQFGHRSQQAFCIGMIWRLADGIGIALLDNLTMVHDDDAITHVSHHRQIVGDEQQSKFQLFLEVFEQVQNLRLHTHIKRANGLIADEESGLNSQSPRYANALALSTAEFMRVMLQTID
jgi:hypothetical protein